MLTQDFVKKLVVKNEKKIVMLVADGLGGLPHPELKKTELEISKHDYLDELAKKSDCGLHEPVGMGIAPGSGPAHLGLFGYDSLKYEIGRGLLDSMGVDFEFQQGDLAARGNFATVDDKGIITDRRAGRVPTEINVKLCKSFDGAEIDGVKVFAMPVREHRFAVVFRPTKDKKLSDQLSDSDPQKEGVKSLVVKSLVSCPLSGPVGEFIAGRDKKIGDQRVLADTATFSASVVNKFIDYANEKIKDQHPANSVLLRGFANTIDIPIFEQVYGLNAVCIASYPMYKGLSRLVGMDVIKDCDGIRSEFSALKLNYSKYDFFFIHIKSTDSAGEDGDFSRKVKAIEEIDLYIPEIFSLNPDVLIVTGDHSTPSVMGSHSWHPVPVLIYSKFSRPVAEVKRFTENEFLKGSLGRISSQSIMPLTLACSQKLVKYGA